MRRLLLAGLLLGLAFTINYRLIVYIAVIVGFDLVWSLRNGGRHPAIRRALSWAAGLVTIAALWQALDLITRAAGFVMFRDELNGQSRWYLQEVIYQLHEGKQSALRFDPAVYAQWLLVRQGWLFCAALLLGIVVALVRRTYPWLPLLVLTVVPYVIYAFAPIVVPRNLAAAVPLACALAAAGLVTPGQKLRPEAGWPVARRLIVPAVLLVSLLVAGVGAAMSWRLTAERSGYAQAAAYTQAHGNGRALVSSEVMVFYLRRPAGCLAPELRSDIYALAASVRGGYRYAVLDHFSWKLSRLVRDRMPLVASFSPDGPADIGEDLLYDEHYPRNGKTHIHAVDVFRLDASRLPPPGASPPYACSYDRV